MTAEDQAWDDFLRRTPFGHFQQTAAWADARAAEGWRAVREIRRRNGAITGGFQILFRRSRLGKIGYVYKGPAVLVGSDAEWAVGAGDLRRTAARLGLRALIVQPPDALGGKFDWAGVPQFQPNRLVNVIRSTLVIDLGVGEARLRGGMRRNIPRESRQAERRGLTLRPGRREDVAPFFALMAATCIRQQAAPAPASAEALVAAWDALSPAGLMELLLAEFGGEMVAGLISVNFGERATLWKKGWSGTHPDKHPNTLLNFTAILRAQAAGYRWLDFAALDDNLADDLLAGRPLRPEHQQLRDIFNLGFGGTPLRLPASRIHFPAAPLRALYRLALTVGPVRRKILPRLMRLASH